jgi:hypothetical protein
MLFFGLVFRNRFVVSLVEFLISRFFGKYFCGWDKKLSFGRYLVKIRGENIIIWGSGGLPPGMLVVRVQFVDF